MSISRKFEAIGTHWQIDLYDVDGQSFDTSALFEKIDARIAVFDKSYSRFRDDSLVGYMAQKSGTYRLPEDAKLLLDTYRTLYTATGGAFTPLIGQTLVQAGYDAKYSLQSQKLTPPPAWDDVLFYEYPVLTLKQPAVLDFGAGGKGYLVDIVSKIILEENIGSFCVDASGDMYYHRADNTPLEVGLEHPEHPEQVIGIAKIINQSIAGSSGNRRAWGNFHHTINPHTLTSPHDILAIWVIADTALIADALTTSLYFTEPKKLLETFAFEYVIMYSDHSVAHSPQIAVTFFN